MDLDFSFTLVSSLTPRSHLTRTPLSANFKLSSSKTLKIQEKQRLSPPRLSDKENQLPKNQQMNKHVTHSKGAEENFLKDDRSDGRVSSCFQVDMTNIALRKRRVKSRRKNKSSPLQSTDNIPVPTETKCDGGNLTAEQIDNSLEKKLTSPCNHLQSESRNLSSEDMFSSTTNKGEKLDGICCEGPNDFCKKPVMKKGVKRKSPRLNESYENSDLGTHCSGTGNVAEINDSFSKISVLTRQQTKIHSIRLSGFSETSLSPAYDSDSIKPVRRQNGRVILETPETDTSASDINKSSLERKTEKANSSNNCKNSSVEERNNSETCVVSLSPKNKTLTKLCDKPGGKPIKKLRSSNELSLSDKFKLKSLTKDQSSSNVKKNEDSLNQTDAKRKLSLSPVLKDVNVKETDMKNTTEYRKGKKSKGTKTSNKKPNCEEEENNCKPLRINGKVKSKKYSPITISSHKSKLVPPLEVIPKFEHVSNWLKDTQEKSVILLSSDTSQDSPKDRMKPSLVKSKLLSLSPRIKHKKKIAESTLNEEQKLFEELYGGDLAKRLSDDVDDVVSIASSSESVELSEKVLEKLYGTVWQKNAVLPQSEPRKGRINASSTRKKSPLTERKKHRTSIYDVFSSSSSEDRFEEFLESVQRGKFETARRKTDRPGTPDFINDSDSDSNASVGFYHNILSSAVKEDTRHKVNRRRLSFASSKDDCSESGKSDTKLAGKETKKNNRKPRSKKKTEDLGKQTTVDGFSLVTPIKIKSKTGDNGLNGRSKQNLECEVPKSVGKSKPSKNGTRKDDNATNEEILRKKYLGEGDFKVPTKVSSSSTPIKSTPRNVPSSPALSFLSSLSEMTAGLPCHPDALAFKKDFKNKKEELTRKLFCLYNREVFENKLPEDMLIQWSSRMTSTSGYCYNKRIYSNNQIFRSSRIVLSTKILDRADRLRDTLIHELCHAATWIVNATSDGHGPNWRAWADKANCRFPELPVIKRCHDYAISTKFTYKCMSCGYCIGRHSKSLDTDRKRCGYCYGKFQVFVTAKMSAVSASATSGSDSVKTQRNPTGFALFVKDNYAAVKKEHNVPHGQVMKLLSQKFAQVKISKQNTDMPAVTVSSVHN